MKIAKLTPFLAVSPQIAEADLGALAAQGFRAVINNRPDGEAEDQPESAALAAAAGRVGLEYRHVPVVSGKITDDDVAAFAQALDEVKGPVLAFCRTGTRSTTLWALAEARHLDPEAILATAAEAGYDLAALKPRLEVRWRSAELATASPGRVVEFAPSETHDVVIVGGGSAGLATAASLLRRRPVAQDRGDRAARAPLLPARLDAGRRRRVRPCAHRARHGGGDAARASGGSAARSRRSSPSATGSCSRTAARIAYRTLVAAPGIELHWAGIEGLQETLGKNGVTSNYLFEMAPYTWELVQTLEGGRALFTQPPMPIKCAGAPQKAMYLACDHWRRRGLLSDIAVEFHTAAPVLFGVKEFVPPLMAYVEKYGAALNLTSNLKAVDGPARKAWFEVKRSDGTSETVERVVRHDPRLPAAAGARRSCATARWRTPPAGSRSAPRRCSIRATATCSAWAMPARRPTPRPRRPRASRRRWWR